MGITDQQVRDAEEAVASKEAELKDLRDKMEIMNTCYYENRRERDRRAQILKKMREDQRELEKLAKMEREATRADTIKVELSGDNTLLGYDHETELQTKLLKMQLEVNESNFCGRAKHY